MNRHEGVSCDACLKANFRGRRYKCLMCFDYDLCAQCYEQGATTTRHITDHPMQCILTRADFELYYGGEVITMDQPQSYTCPYCSRMGFTEVTLQEHVCSEHPDTSFEVVCPVCAAMIGGDPNMVTDDLAGHLAVEHRAGGANTAGSGGPRDLISFLDDPSASTVSNSSGSTAVRHGMRRTTHGPRGVAGSRARRSNMHFNSSGGLSSLSPSARDSVDPIAELLSQLSGVRRSAASGMSASSTAHAPNNPTQLQQLQMQLQLERQQVQAARQQLERLPRRQTASSNLTASAATTSLIGASDTATRNSTIGGATTSGGSSATGAVSVSVSGSSGLLPTSGFYCPLSPIISKQQSANSSDNSQPSFNYQFLLSSNIEEPLSEEEQEKLEELRANRSLFVQEILFATLTESFDNNNQSTKLSDVVVGSSSSGSSSSTSSSSSNNNGAPDSGNGNSSNHGGATTNNKKTKSIDTKSASKLQQQQQQQQRLNLTELKQALPSTQISNNTVMTSGSSNSGISNTMTTSQQQSQRITGGRGHRRSRNLNMAHTSSQPLSSEQSSHLDQQQQLQTAIPPSSQIQQAGGGAVADTLTSDNLQKASTTSTTNLTSATKLNSKLKSHAVKTAPSSTR